MKKVLCIGNSACTFAVGAAYKRGGARVFAYGQTVNPGFFDIAEGYEKGMLDDMDKIRDFAARVRPDFAFIGPANPIADGAADMLAELGIPSVAPLRKAAVVESSKAFTRELFRKYGIPGNIRYRVFTSEEGMKEFVAELDGEFVVKADGLMYGMGVQVSGDHFETVEEGLRYAKEYLRLHGRVVIEEKLVGEEFSLMSFCDGATTLDMPPVQDFKRALAGDRGPNTGGMGTYTDANHLLPFLTRSEYEAASAITRQLAGAIRAELGIPFKGVLFGGFMATKNGIKVLEFNARVGDSEGVNTFSLLKTNLVDLSLSLIAGEMAGMKAEFLRQASVCKYVVPVGYPTSGQDGARITVGAVPPGVELYTAWVRRGDNGDLFITGEGGVVGRAIAVLAKADTLAQAELLAEAACNGVTGPVYHRSDIASPALLAEKVRRMEALQRAAAVRS